MQKNQTKEASFLQIFLSAIKFIFLSMQFGYWSQYFWLIIMEQVRFFAKNSLLISNPPFRFPRGSPKASF